MITHQLALIRREIWEHRSLYVTPAVVGFVMSLMLLTGFVFASNYAEIIDIGVFSAQNLAGDVERRAAVFAFLLANTAPFLFASAILTIFYCLDSLYAERKNKSILFWRSLPITDAETVISKMLTATVAIPVIFIGFIVVTHLVILIMTSIFVSIEGGSSMLLIWRSAPVFDVWFSTLVITLMLSVWFSPFIGWFLFVSAWTKRSPLLMAFLPLIVVPMLEYFVLRTHLIGDAIESRFNQLPLFSGTSTLENIFDDRQFIADAEIFSLVAYIDIGKFLASPAMWAGVVVCGLFVTAAIYVRRYRDDS
jgi:ABC-2 type transport system permease protein